MQKEDNKTFYIENLGCSKNQVDAEVMMAVLEKEGWEYASDPDNAGLIIVNTCGFIEAAKTESIDTAISFRDIYPGKKILMAGCFAQRYGSTLLDKMPEIDGVFGNLNLQVVPEVAESIILGERPAILPLEGSSRPERKSLLSFPGSAYVKISEGCNHRCSYCAIPIIRGNLRSRAIDDIILEIKGLLKCGIVEINLIAQDLAALGTDKKKKDFIKLLGEVSKLEGKFWIRLLYIHPDFFPPELLDIIASEKRILPYFDIPFQHASASVLNNMGRNGSSSRYLDLVKTIRTKIPDSVIRSTFMVGFPGEKAAHRRELLEFLTEASLDWVGTFIYSREEDTRAYSMRGDLAHKFIQPIASKFKRKLELEQTKITEHQMDRFIGLDLDILIEEKVKSESMALGRAYIHAAEVDGSVVVLTDKAVPGEFLECRITGRNGIDLEAVPLNEL
ncbi:MAG: 30S ribosomal protein S12 methylthiotransferase RimO [Spirochaetia bacterium]|jgi:ribosomal protein S12 methylthiotransferase|nr:30S ribosomal protein S12 methylthiotransferase RimO [Spirochaetia bacterium]